MRVSATPLCTDERVKGRRTEGGGERLSMCTLYLPPIATPPPPLSGGGMRSYSTAIPSREERYLPLPPTVSIYSTTTLIQSTVSYSETTRVQKERERGKVVGGETIGCVPSGDVSYKVTTHTQAGAPHPSTCLWHSRSGCSEGRISRCD